MPGRGDNEVPVGTRATVDGVPWILTADGWGLVADLQPLEPPDAAGPVRPAIRAAHGFFFGRWVRHNPYLGCWVLQPLEPPVMPVGPITQRLRAGKWRAIHVVSWEAHDDPDPGYPLFDEGWWVCTCGARWHRKLPIPSTVEGVLPSFRDPAAVWGPEVLDHLRGVPR